MVGHTSYKKKEISPEAFELSDPHTGVYFPLIAAVKCTLEQVLPNLINASENLGCQIEFGFNGSGSQAI